MLITKPTILLIGLCVDLTFNLTFNLIFGHLIHYYALLPHIYFDSEMAAALESVFPRVSLKAFVSLKAEDKRKQLSELMNIVLGIRLFNKEIGKGGHDLESLEVICAEEANAAISDLQSKLAECDKKCQEYVDVLLYVIYGDGNAGEVQVIQL